MTEPLRDSVIPVLPDRAAPVRRSSQIVRIGVIGACALTACAHYTPKPLPLTASADAYAARSLTAPQWRDVIEARLPGATATWPPLRWNRAMLLLIAIGQNPDLKVGRAEVGEALARTTSAAEVPNPTLTLQSEYARDEAHPWLYGFALDALLRAPSRKRLDIDIAALAGDAARWKLVDRTWQLRAALTAALSDWQAAAARAAQLDRLIDAQRSALGVQQRRIELGEDAAGDSVLVRQGLLDAEQQRASANTDVVAAQSALAAALGMPPAALDGIAIDWPEWGTPPTLTETSVQAECEAALLSRADLDAAIADYAGAEKQLQRAIARQYPEFHLNPGYYWDHGVAKWPFDVAFAPPVFNRNEGEIAEATAAREAAAARMLALQAGIIGTIDAARRAEHVAAVNAKTATQRAGIARRQMLRDEHAVQLGATDRRDALAAAAVAARSEVDVIEARAAWQRARNALEDALHAPLSGAELQLRPVLDADAPDQAIVEAPP